MALRSKRYRQNVTLVDRQRDYTTREAVEILKRFQPASFDETVTVAIRLGIDPKKTEQSIRGSFSLPHGIGKEMRVVAFADGKLAEDAKKAGAIEVGTQDLAQKIEGGWLDFDVAIAHPQMMRFVGKLGRILGPVGKMPSPKGGTVTENVALAVKEFRAGKIEFRSDATGNIHAPVGKASFPLEKLVENVDALIDHVRGLRPATAKGLFVEKAVVSSTMSPGLKVKIA